MSVNFRSAAHIGAESHHYYRQLSAPTSLDPLQVGDLWSDTTANLLKRCTSVSPITFVSTEGGSAGHDLFSTTHGDVDEADTPADGQILKFNLAAAKWRAEDDAAGHGDNAHDGTILSNVLASRPAAANVDRFFWATDEHILYRDTGAAWVKASVADHPDLDSAGPDDHHSQSHSDGDHTAGFAAPTGVIDIGDAAAEGAGATHSRSDHQHGFTAPSAGYPLDVAAAEADGTATTPARSDHGHAHGSGYSPDAHHARSHDHSQAADGDTVTPATLNIPFAVTPAQTAEGQAVWDSDGGVTGETWQWARTTTPDMMASWMDIDSATDAAYMVTAGDEGYYLRVMATYTDAAGTDMAMAYSMPTMMVGAVVDEPGMVTLWASPTEELTMAPQVGDTITGLVMDPDGGVTGESWQWSRTMDTADMSSWMDIQDATDAAYMVTAGDEGYYLRVMATYTDAVGTDMAMVHSMPTMMVTAVDETQPADFDPLAEYDADNSGALDQDEAFKAINDYIYHNAISRANVIETIKLYLFG